MNIYNKKREKLDSWLLNSHLMGWKISMVWFVFYIVIWLKVFESASGAGAAIPNNMSNLLNNNYK